eukprot:4929363-Lingulodinium_polyedra.AAC.1
MALPSFSHPAPPLHEPCYCATCCFWLANLHSSREYCRGNRHRKRAHNAATPDPAPPAWLTDMCRDALWVIYVRRAARAARRGTHDATQ